MCRAESFATSHPSMFARCWRAPGARVSGPAVILVHGLALSGRYLRPTAERLAAAERDLHVYADVYAPDLPGHGRSGTPPAALDVPGLAAVLGAWLDVAVGRPVLLVGHSLGAQVVAELARRAPARVVGVVLAAPTVDPAHRAAGAEIARLLRDAPRERPALLALAAAAYARSGPRRALATLRYAIAHRLEDTVPALAMPVQVIHGTRDPLVSAAWAARLAALTDRAPITLPGAPHGMPYSSAPAFAAAVIATLHAMAGRGGGHHGGGHHDGVPCDVRSAPAAAVSTPALPR